MRKIFVILLILFNATNLFVANDSIFHNDDVKIFIFREDVYLASAVNFTVIANDSEIVRLRNNSFYEYDCPAGNYTFSIIEYKNVNLLSFKAESGKTYYIRFGIKQGFWNAVPELILINESSALPILENTNIRRIIDTNTHFVRPKNSLGFELGGGIGTKSQNLYTLNNGQSAKFSFGGGFTLGLVYGMEFSKYFDLQGKIAYSQSSLTPAIKDVKVNFSRSALSLTPHIIIPLKGGETMRLKLGAGGDYYFWNKFKWKDSFNSITVDYAYKDAIGYHAELLFDLNAGDKWSYVYGIRWNGAIFNSQNFSQLEEFFFDKPNGNGINFVLRMNYHF